MNASYGKAMLLVCLLCAAGARGDLARERWFLWDQANSRMSSAQTPAEFLAAAALYQDLADTGVQNGPLFYNLGLALLMGEQYEPALRALIRAERYLGATPEIRRNMQLARAGRDPGGDAAPPWYRVLLFWHFGIPAAVRTTVALVAFAGIWLALILRAFRFRHGFRPFLVCCLVVLVLFGSSAATTWLLEGTAAESSVRLVTAPADPLSQAEGGD